MKNFVFLYNSDPTEVPSPEAMEPWMKWFGAIGESIVNMGNPLMNGMLVNANGYEKITDSMHPVNGYTVIKAQDMAAAIEIAKSCPGKAGMQVYEAMEM